MKSLVVISLIVMASCSVFAGNEGKASSGADVILRQFGMARSEMGASQWGSLHYFAVSNSGKLYYSNSDAILGGTSSFQEFLCTSPSLRNGATCLTGPSNGKFVFPADFTAQQDGQIMDGYFTFDSAPRGARGDGLFSFRFMSHMRPLAFSASLGKYPEVAESCANGAAQKLASLAVSQNTALDQSSIYVSAVKTNWMQNKKISFSSKTANDQNLTVTMTKKSFGDECE